MTRINFNGSDLFLTAGMVNATTGKQIFGLFANETDAEDCHADDLAVAIVSRDQLTDEQIAVAEANCEEISRRADARMAGE